MRTDMGQIAMADSNMLNLDLAVTHRLTLINRIPLRALFTSAYREASAYCEDVLLEPITKTKPSRSAVSDGARYTHWRSGY